MKKPLPRFTAVIHCQNVLQTLNQAKLALENGADGLFLIDHARPYTELLELYRVLRVDFPEAWVGLNFLDLDAVTALRVRPEDADAIWVDDIGDVRLGLAGATDWRLFGAAAFKYQRVLHAPGGTIGPDAYAASFTAARLRMQDVITTSGPGTGQPASVGKLQEMTAHVPQAHFALASGVTPENVGDFLPYVDCFLVATGISKSFHEFDADKVRRLAQRIAADAPR